MPLTPLDIYNKEFKKSLRGYNEDEVNEFLDEVVRDYEALIREHDEMKEGVSGLTERVEQYRKIEETLKNTLVLAESTAEEVKKAAQKEAELIVREAEARSRAMIAEAEERVRAVRAEQEQLFRELERFRASARSLLESQLAMLKEERFTPSLAAVHDTMK